MEGLAQLNKRKEIINRVIPLGAIKAHPRNYQRHPESQIAELMASLQRFGQVRSLVVQEQDGSYLMVAGHGVMEAARRLEWEELRADVLPATWTAEQVMAYLVADNELAKQAEPDEVQLATLLKELEAAEFGLEGLGWDEDELEALIDELGMGEETPVDPGPQLDKAEELRERWGVCTGQVWEMGEHRLVCGDCTDRAVVEAVMKGEKAILCLTDPPYNYDVEYESVSDNLTPEEYETFTRKWWAIAKGYARCLVVTPGLKNLDFYYRNFKVTWTCAWVKKNAMTASAIGPLSVWEPIIFQDDEWDWEPVVVFGKPRKKVKRDVYEFPIQIQKGVGHHPCPKLLAFWERLVSDFSQPGDTIHDPFVGSGTTIIACERLGRRGRAIEIDPGYCAVAIQRWADMTGGEPHLVEE